MYQTTRYQIPEHRNLEPQTQALHAKPMSCDLGQALLETVLHKIEVLQISE
jgi:hypothetical protein